MSRIAIVLLFIAGPVSAEVHPLTLQQTLDLAARQNPDVVLARLDEQRAEEAITVAQDPFRPKVYGGSGLAYVYGYPNSIEGNAPSLFQIKTDMNLYNKPKSYQIAAARETAHASEYAAEAKADTAAYEAADLFLTASEMERQDESISTQIPSLQKVVQSMAAAVEEGTELPVELKRARVSLALSQERVGAARLDADYYEMMLAVALGYPANDRVKPIDAELPASITLPSEDQASDSALHNSRELRQMQATVLAKEMDVRSFKSARRPQVDLVAQYALFARYNYQYYFPSSKFQHNNFEIGAAVTIPVLLGAARGGQLAQTYTDLQKLRVQTDQVRNRILTETRRSYEQWQKAESIRDLYRMQLDLAREDLTVLLAQNGEGRVPMSRVERARVEESDRWIALYDAETQVTRAKLAILRQMGTLVAALRTPAAEAHP
ncbi:MAG TPA: TolC family protein [Bryobacteraceae bacterium]|nr:TolC family protein [Bryobacteraceae bacterium]